MINFANGMSEEAYDPQVLTFYYPWYGTPWGPSETDDWYGWGGHRFDPGWVQEGRREVRACHYPLAGLYDSLNEETIRRHLDQAQLAGLDGFIISWWGFEDVPGSQTLAARATEKVVELAPDDFSVTVYHETVDYDDDRGVEETAVDDISRLIDEYGDDRSWLTVDGSPVIFEYGRVVSEVEQQGDGQDSWRRVYDKLSDEGYDPFIVGDSLDPDDAEVFDGLHTYNPTGLITQGHDVGDAYERAAEGARERGKLFAGTVLPGYDDRFQSSRTREGGGYLIVPREDGGRYEKTWNAVEGADSDWALVTTWNEWYEGSTIEPAREYGLDYVDLTRQYAENFRGD